MRPHTEEREGESRRVTFSSRNAEGLWRRTCESALSKVCKDCSRSAGVTERLSPEYRTHGNPQKARSQRWAPVVAAGLVVQVGKAPADI